MHELQQWLSTTPRDYSRGVFLYSVYGPYKSVLALLQKGETDLTRAKLNEALREVWDDLQTKKAATKPATNLPGYQKVVIHPGNPPATSKISNPQSKIVQDLDNQWKPLYAEMAVLHARLAMCSTNQQRYHLADQILKLEQQVIDIWDKRDEYLKTGKLPAAKPRKVVNTAHLTSNQHRQLTNLRTYISRMERSVLPGLTKKQAEKPTKRRALRIKENEDKLAGWKQQLNQLEHG